MKKRITAMLIVLTMLLGLMPGRACAASTISSVKLSLNIASIGLNETQKEGTVANAIYHNTTVQTAGLNIDPGNTGLRFWNVIDSEIYGIGSGNNNVKVDRQYYAGIYLKLSGEYVWLDAIKKLPDKQHVPVRDVQGFRVFFNGEERIDAYVNYNKIWNSLAIIVPIANDVMSEASATLISNTYMYDGTIKKPKVKSVTPTGGITALPDNCEITCTDMSGNIVTPINVGKYVAAVTLKKGIYGGTKKITFQITKAPNTMTTQGKKVKIKASKLKKKKQVIKCSKSMGICTAVGKLQFKLAKVNKKKFKMFFKVNAKNGNITVKKGLKKGTYKLTINVTAAGNGNYLSATKPVVVTIRVK